MKPFEYCPFCNVSVRWILHDGANVYDCKNKECPIKFTEYVYYPPGRNDYKLSDQDAKLINCHFIVGQFRIAIVSDEAHISSNHKWALKVPFSRLDFSDIQLLEQKIKTWIVFS